MSSKMKVTTKFCLYAKNKVACMASSMYKTVTVNKAGGNAISPKVQKYGYVVSHLVQRYITNSNSVQ